MSEHREALWVDCSVGGGPSAPNAWVLGITPSEPVAGSWLAACVVVSGGTIEHLTEPCLVTCVCFCNVSHRHTARALHELHIILFAHVTVITDAITRPIAMPIYVAITMIGVGQICSAPQRKPRLVYIHADA